MIVIVEAIVDAIYASEYKDKEGNEKLSYNIEIRNPEFTSRYNRLYSLGVDKDCWKKLDLVNEGKNFEGQKCQLTCSMTQFRGQFNLYVSNIEIIE